MWAAVFPPAAPLHLIPDVARVRALRRAAGPGLAALLLQRLAGAVILLLGDRASSGGGALVVFLPSRMGQEGDCWGALCGRTGKVLEPGLRRCPRSSLLPVKRFTALAPLVQG